MIKKKLLIFIVAYNAERTIGSVLSRIPIDLVVDFQVEVLIIDDASSDKTFEAGVLSRADLGLPFTVTILVNPVNQGYGGNQKIGYHYAIKYKFDYVALIHGDGQYAPECLPELMRAFTNQDVGAVFGSRMLNPRDALKGGMPLYKYVGNKVLTKIENYLLRASLSEFHSGYRIYAIPFLKSIPFSLNTNDFHFDTEIIIQCVLSGYKIIELPIPTYYGSEICHVNGIKYAYDVVMSVLKMRAQELSIFYDRKYDICNRYSSGSYQLKISGLSTHTLALDLVRRGSSVLDIGCSSGYVGQLLKNWKHCSVTGVDKYPLRGQEALDSFICHDLFTGPPSVDYANYQYLLLLDVVEHLPSPEEFVENLYTRLSMCEDITLVVSTGNIGFFITRIMLLLGQFNYGKRGILDLTHTRLFTFKTVRQLFSQANYEILEQKGVPAPFALAIGDGFISKILTNLNNFLIRILPSIFAYQIFLIIKPKPSLEKLLGSAFQLTKDKHKSSQSNS